MKKFNFEKATNKLQKCRMNLIGLSTIAMTSMPMITQANGWSQGTQNAESVIGKIADVVVNIFPLFGVFLLISGGFKWVMAHRSNQAEAQSDAAKELVIGLVLIVFRAFLWNPIKDAIGM